MSTDAIVEAPSLPVSEEPRPAGISSPPDSSGALKLDGSDSELSDIEEPEEDIGEVVPDRYEGGVPIFIPTMEQFKSFTPFMKKINHIGMKTGIVKVIPPKEWTESLPPLDEAIKTIRVKDPIAQEIMGTGGTYRQVNIQHQRSYNLPQWRQLCEQSEHQPPAKRGERRANQENNSRSGLRSKGIPTATSSGTKKRGPGRPSRKPSTIENPDGDENTNEIRDRLPTPLSPSVKVEDDLESIKNDGDDEGKLQSKRKASRQPKAIASVSSRRKYNRREAAGKIDEAAFENFEYRLVGEEYTKERCEELEKAYWKTLTYAPPLYGADMPGSLFDESVTSWNLGRLENLLDILGTKIPGVNTAYLYLGMWKATFAWHLEDVDLYSINFNHFGAPKQWYSIAQKDARRFEAAMKSIWPVDAKACDQFLRHKTFLISPTTLWEKYNVKVNKVVHHPGEFVITFPYGYHSGFNLGYNAAEAVNFAMESWLELGRVAKKCDCDQAQDSVWIDEHDMRKLRGEETEFEESEGDEEDEDEDGPNDLPTPPGSSGDTKTPRRKRKRPIKEANGQPATKRIRIRIPAKQPCVLCPNDIASEELLPTDNGNKAHRICAQYIPETEIEPGTIEMVTGTGSISKARLELKCNYCRSKKGAAFQCSQKKCFRAYHATCAAAAGVFVEEGERPVFGPDGTEYKEHAFEFSCRFHRVKRDKKLDAEALENDPRIRSRASKLAVGDKCQLQYYRGDIFAGVVVENRTLEEILLVHILPRGERVEVAYKWLLLEDAADYHMPKPSANAIPLPQKSKQSLVTSKRQANDLPRKEDPFVPGYTWEEFNTFKLERNPFQVKVDFSKENQIWFYLGKNSTDAKAQFTEDPAKPRHNPKGHFLDTLPKPLPTSRHSYPASFPSSGVNQNALNAARATGRPSLPATSTRPEKPYEYKPRGSTEAYRHSVDPQSYRRQQNFLQNPIPPYAFGSDPRWPSPNDRSSAPYQSHRQSIPSTHHGPTSLSLMGPPSAAQSRPVSGTQAPAKPVNPFSYPPMRNNINNSRTSSGGRSYTMPNPFAKYPYLQKQHNRSPMDYKSPYSQNGGFMNGYEGDLKEHLRRNPDALFRTQRSLSHSSPMAPNPLLAYSNGLRQSQSPSLPYSSSTQSSISQPGYTAPAMPSYTSNALLSGYSSNTQSVHNQQSPPAQHLAKSVSSNVWERKDSSSLHPAIRQEYGSMFHHQYQPHSQTPASQHSQNGHHSTYQSSEAPQQYQTAGLTQTSYEGRAAPSAQSQPMQSQHSITQSPTPFAQAYQSQQPQQLEDKKPIYAHQQYFQNTQTQQQNQPPTQPQPQKQLQPQPQPQQQSQSRSQSQPLTRDVPDVPVDSTTLVEEMMANLRSYASRQA